MAEPGPWQVFSQVIDNRRMYIAGRLRDPTQPLHGGNVEYSGGYVPDRALIERRVLDLNAGGIMTRYTYIGEASRISPCGFKAGSQEFCRSNQCPGRIDNTCPFIYARAGGKVVPVLSEAFKHLFKVGE